MFFVFCRERFREGRVLVFGSAASTLSVPESDIDLTLHLPSRIQLVQELKVRKHQPTYITAVFGIHPRSPRSITFPV